MVFPVHRHFTNIIMSISNDTNYHTLIWCSFFVFDLRVNSIYFNMTNLIYNHVKDKSFTISIWLVDLYHH